MKIGRAEGAVLKKIENGSLIMKTLGGGVSHQDGEHVLAEFLRA